MKNYENYETKTDKRQKQKNKLSKKQIKHGIGAWYPTYNNEVSKGIKKIIADKIRGR